MSKEELGTLIVVILKGRNLIDKHSFYKQDVYCQAALNGTVQKSEVDAKGGQHPVWDSELRFPIMKDSAEKYRKLEISCWSKEPRTDEILGTGKIDVTETLKTGEFDDWILLDIDGVQRGEVYLEMTYFSNAPPPAPKAPTKQHQHQQTMLAPPVIQPGKPLQRRPSKWAPTERLARPASYYQVPTQLKPAGRPDVSPIRNGQHLNLHPNPHSPPSSRSSSHSPTHKHDVLPPLPNEGPARVPTILRPGPKAGSAPSSRPLSFEIPSSHRNSYPNPYDDPPLPARNDQAPPPSHTPNPLWADHHEYNSSTAPPMFPLPNVTVAPATPAPVQGHPPAPPPPASTPSPYTYYQPPSHSNYAPPQQQPTFSPPGVAPQHQQPYPPLPVPPQQQQQTYPQSPPAQTPYPTNQYPPQPYYGQPAYSPAPYSHPQYHQSPPPPERDNLPDPYLIARYQTPLPCHRVPWRLPILCQTRRLHTGSPPLRAGSHLLQGNRLLHEDSRRLQENSRLRQRRILASWNYAPQKPQQRAGENKRNAIWS
ncbi:hypothetical protein CPB85DRAFT_1248429 [Mucidula mucida]|nr:hypothetical protein CPB85DRAFT_1248429 [Mucidula mucida]